MTAVVTASVLGGILAVLTALVLAFLVKDIDDPIGIPEFEPTNLLPRHAGSRLNLAGFFQNVCFFIFPFFSLTKDCLPCGTFCCHSDQEMIFQLSLTGRDLAPGNFQSLWRRVSQTKLITRHVQTWLSVVTYQLRLHSCWRRVDRLCGCRKAGFDICAPI